MTYHHRPLLVLTFVVVLAVAVVVWVHAGTKTVREIGDSPTTFEG